jgi:hypothetical protein
MKHSDFDNSQSGVPQPVLNGGLYTGEKFKGNWGNTYVQPDVIFMTNKNLISANPPQHALTQYGDIIRPGNNVPKFMNIHKFSNKHNIVCTGSFKNTSFKSHNPSLHNQMTIDHI